jgi:histidinol dehydrogenase
MRVVSIDWIDPDAAARAIRGVVARTERPRDVGSIRERVAVEGDAAVLDLTNRFDATASPRESLRLDPGEGEEALASLDPALRDSLELAIENVRSVAAVQMSERDELVAMPQGHSVTIRSVPVGSAGIYAPGGRAAYPSSVLMCAVPAQVAGVRRIALASPPGPDGRIAAPVLAAAALCQIEEVYAMGGAQAIFALAQGTEEVEPVDVIAGPGNAWVQEAKRVVDGTVGIDSYAGPSELLVVAGVDTDPQPAALDLCAQAEHGEGGMLALASTDPAAIEAISSAAEGIGERRGVDPGALVNTVVVPSVRDAIALANALAPEHLELLDPAAAAMAADVTTAGCVFVGPYSATAFGDYVAGSNHVLPTGGAGRFSGPLGPDVFRRKIATVEVPPEAAAKLAPHVDRIARAEGFPLHGESAMIRAKEGT